MEDIILGIDNVYYFVEDINRAVKFYAGILDLQVLDKSDQWATLLLGNKVRLGLHKAAAKDFTRTASGIRGGATLSLAVKNIDLAVSALQARGVKFISEIDRNSWGSVISFSDPDGNLIDLKEHR